MFATAKTRIQTTLHDIRDAGLEKCERIITSPQSARIEANGRQVVNLCANNYLDLANHPEIRKAAHEALDRWGFGLASVRFICGTQTLHKLLEDRLTAFLGTEDTILYSSCFDANGGLFETLLGENDAVISDQLNHASIIDGIRLCKARRFRYANNDMADLEAKLREADAGGARTKLITTDGVFSMDGYVARLDQVCDLADQYDALVHFDDCHATGFLGDRGMGTHAFRHCVQRIDLTTGTLGKALGGASGGYTSGRKELIELLRQRSRPYLFSNSVAPMIAGAALRAIDMIESDEQGLRDKLFDNTRYWRQALMAAGFDVLSGDHPITPVMFYDEKVAGEFADRLLQRGVYAIAFSYPVVPRGLARIRTQVSAGHSHDDLQFSVEQFVAVRDEMGLQGDPSRMSDR